MAAGRPGPARRARVKRLLVVSNGYGEDVEAARRMTHNSIAECGATYSERGSARYTTGPPAAAAIQRQ